MAAATKQIGFPGADGQPAIVFNKKRGLPELNLAGWRRVQVFAKEVVISADAAELFPASTKLLTAELKTRKLSFANVVACGKALLVFLKDAGYTGRWKLASDRSAAAKFRSLIKGFEHLPENMDAAATALENKAKALISADTSKKGKSSGIALGASDKQRLPQLRAFMACLYSTPTKALRAELVKLGGMGNLKMAADPDPNAVGRFALEMARAAVQKAAAEEKEQEDNGLECDACDGVSNVSSVLHEPGSTDTWDLCAVCWIKAMADIKKRTKG